MYQLNLENADHVGAQLARVIKDFHGKAGKAGMREVGQMMAKDLRSRVGSRSGALRKSITAKHMTRQVKGWYGVDTKDAGMEVGALRKVQDTSGRKRMQLYKFRWQETGTNKHMIRAWAGNKQLSRSAVVKLNKSGSVLRRSVLHPGQKANRQLQGVMSRNEGKADAVFSRGVGKLLRKYGVQGG